MTPEYVRGWEDAVRMMKALNSSPIPLTQTLCPNETIVKGIPESILKPPYIYGDAPLYSANQYPLSTKALGQQTGNAVMRPDDGKTSTP